MQRAMAKQAEAERERRSKIIHAEGEFSAAQKLVDAAAAAGHAADDAAIAISADVDGDRGGEEHDDRIPAADGIAVDFEQDVGEYSAGGCSDCGQSHGACVRDYCGRIQPGGVCVDSSRAIPDCDGCLREFIEEIQDSRRLYPEASMQRGFGGTTFEPAHTERRDREMTIGPVLLMLIGCGLFGLCGLCFVFGYSVGHRNAETSTAVSVPPPVASGQPRQSGSSLAKPTAGQSGAQAAVPAPSDPSSETGAGDSADAGSTSTASTSARLEARVVPAVQTTQQPSGSGTVQPALSSQSGSIMVQIAAVSHPEDADVLVGALRKRGYAVTARRDPTDGLLHVQVGPFANRNDAYAMRQKLLNDGYNAILQP